METVYTCPMHPNIKSEKEGRCPECGMALVPEKRKTKQHDPEGKHASDGAGKHKGHHKANFLKKFYITLILTVPILLYSHLFTVAFGWNPPSFKGVEYVIFILGTIIFFYGGGIFLQSAFREIRARLPGMMTLIAVAITAAYGFSVYVTFSGQGETLFWELATLIAVMLIGHYLEMKAVQGAKGSLKALAQLIPDIAEVVEGSTTKKVSVSELSKDMHVLVRPGARIPADGLIIEGSSEVDESIITGESKPVSKKKEDSVVAGSLNGDGSLTIMVTHIGEETFLAGVMRLVADAESSKSRLQMLSDRAALYLTIVAIGAGVVTLISWLYLGEGTFFAFERMVTVLVITCPHALGLAVPLVASISTTMGAKNGLLVRKRLSLEEARKIDTIVFDKTGTLTEGSFGVDQIVSLVGDEQEVLAIAASVNQDSEHSLAQAIRKEAEKRNITVLPSKDFERLAGKGAQAVLDSTLCAIGNEALLKDKNISLPEVYKKQVALLEGQGKTVVHVVKGNTLIGSIALADVIRPESNHVIARLKELGVQSVMITGDAEDVATYVAKEVGIEEYFAGVLPGGKAEKIRFLQDQGKRVAMVGDGINDAPALAQADLGIAIGAGTNVAIESAGIILVKSDPRDIPKIITLSKFTYTKMMQNIFWATGYNVVALPLAAGVLYSKGIMLNPAVAAVFMSLSTVIVAVNAVLLKRKKL